MNRNVLALVALSCFPPAPGPTISDVSAAIRETRTRPILSLRTPDGVMHPTQLLEMSKRRRRQRQTKRGKRGKR